MSALQWEALSPSSRVGGGSAADPPAHAHILTVKFTPGSGGVSAPHLFGLSRAGLQPCASAKCQTKTQSSWVPRREKSLGLVAPAPLTVASSPLPDTQTSSLSAPPRTARLKTLSKGAWTTAECTCKEHGCPERERSCSS